MPQSAYQIARTFGRQWGYKLEVGDLFQDDDMPFLAKRDGVVARIKAAPFYMDEPGDDHDAEELYWIVDEMADTEDVDQFDSVWDAFYDWCDWDKRVWVETMRAPEDAISS